MSTIVIEGAGLNSRQALIFIAIASLFAAVGAAVVLAADLVLLLFGAVVFATFIRALGDFLSAKTRLRPQLALTMVLFTLLGLAVLSAVLLTPAFVAQFEDLVQRLPSTFERIRSFVDQIPGAKRLLNDLGELGGEGGETLTGIVDALSVSIGGMLNIMVILVTGMYLAFQPDLYTKGVLRLFPIPWRGRAAEVIAALGSTLRMFLLGRVVSMIAVGVVTWIGLALIGVPASGLLGLVAGVLTFVPYAGPIAASIPIGLAALLEGHSVLAYALIFYTVVQMLEGFFITPLVQERVVTLPPALTLAAEVFMGLIFGAMGVILAVPAAAIGVAAVRLLYIEDLLGDKADATGSGNRRPGNTALDGS